MARYSLRITRFDDQRSFQRVAAFLSSLYPDRDPEEFETALARLPCVVTHDGDESAARELERALIVRGARTLMTPVGSADQTLTEDDSPSQEVDAAFLSQRNLPRLQPSKPNPKRRAFFKRGAPPAPWDEG
jgi:hypothetical protein